MTRMARRAVIGAAFAGACIGSVHAQAAALSFVSVKGTNSGNCSLPTAPCRTFAYALGQTTAGGEIRALDAGNYVPTSIKKSITISGPPGAGILRTSAGNAIYIGAGASDVVTLDGLTLNGFNKTATTGVRVNSASRVVIRNCAIRNFSAQGILFLPTVATKFLIENSLITNNGNSGVYLDSGSATGAATGDLNRVTISGSSTGLILATRANARVSDSMIAHNALEGAYVSPLSSVAFRITRSVVTQNGTGVLVDTGAGTPLAETGHDNFIFGNATTNISGTLTNVGTN